MSASAPIETCIQNWHLHLRGDLPGGLDTILHEDCTFLSPIVFTPQQGRDITKLYLTAASGTLGGTEGSVADAMTSPSSAGGFRYVKEIVQGHHAMLEFETAVEGKYANGVDIITCDDDGMITEFKVMMRPLQAVNAVHAQMQAMLEQLAE
jgi:hypothetical protein